MAPTEVVPVIVLVPLTVHTFHYLERKPTTGITVGTVTTVIKVTAIKASQIKALAMDRPYRMSETLTAS